MRLVVTILLYAYSSTIGSGATGSGATGSGTTGSAVVGSEEGSCILIGTNYNSLRM